MEVMSIEDVDELLAKISGMKNYKKKKKKHFISNDEIEKILNEVRNTIDIDNSNETILFDLPLETK